MPTIREVKTELRHREWAEQIQECQSRSMTVTAWCKENGMSAIEQLSKCLVGYVVIKRPGDVQFLSAVEY